jgi:predicted nucleotidyltransferase
MSMTRREVLSMLSEHLLELRQRFGVVRLSLFGSVVRDEAREDSDVDIPVDFGKAPDFDQYMEAKFFLEDLLERTVDLVTVGGLRHEAWAYVEEDLLEISSVNTAHLESV